MELTTNYIIDYLKEQGAALVGVSPIKPLLTDERYEKNIERICPNAKCVIVLANVFPQSVLDACPDNPRPARYTLHALYSEGEGYCIKVSRLLEKNGFRGVIIPAYLPVEMSYETRGFKGDLHLRHAALEAGLGTRGKSDLLITPEFGPRIRLFGVVTDADLEPTPKITEDLCTNCDICIKSCPSKALGESGGCNPNLCSLYAMKNGLPRIVGFLREVGKEPDREKRIKKLTGLEMWNYWQALSQGSFYECFMCIQSCPVGKIKFKK